jgi:hypothetical protein
MMSQDVRQKQLSNSENRSFTSTETRIATRAILRQMQSKKAPVLHGQSQLHQQEVGLFLAEHARILFLAASAANLPSLEKKAELLFYEAYMVANGVLPEAALTGRGGEPESASELP